MDLAAWLRSGGDEIKAISVPAGSVRVRADGERVFVTALQEWAPAFALDRLSSPAVRLTAQIGRDLEIRQGEGSLLRTHVRYLGQQIEVGGRVSEARITELR